MSIKIRKMTDIAWDFKSLASAYFAMPADKSYIIIYIAGKFVKG